MTSNIHGNQKDMAAAKKTWVGRAQLHRNVEI